MTTATPHEGSESYTISFRMQEPNLLVGLTGVFNLKNLTAFTGGIRREIAGGTFQSITIDFSGVTYLDSASARFRTIEQDCALRGISCHLTNLNDEPRAFSASSMPRPLPARLSRKKTPMKDSSVRSDRLPCLSPATLSVSSRLSATSWSLFFTRCDIREPCGAKTFCFMSSAPAWTACPSSA
jgi:anti-anti-sigma regulatory factor